MLGSPKPAPRDELAYAIRIGEREDPGSAGFRSRQVTALHQGDSGDRGPQVLVRAGPDRERDPPPLTQDAAGLGERRPRVGHQHVSEPGDHAVDARVVEVHPLGVEDPELDVRQAELSAATAGHLDHPRGEVGRDHPSLIADTLADQKARVAGPGGELEHRVAGARVEPFDQPLADRPGVLPEEIVLLVPVAREPIPGVQ